MILHFCQGCADLFLTVVKKNNNVFQFFHFLSFRCGAEVLVVTCSTGRRKFRLYGSIAEAATRAVCFDVKTRSWGDFQVSRGRQVRYRLKSSNRCLPGPSKSGGFWPPRLTSKRLWT